MASHIRSPIQYLVPTYSILALLFYSNMMKYTSLIDGLEYDFIDKLVVAYYIYEVYLHQVQNIKKKR